MTDRLLSSLLWLLVMGLIMFIGAAALSLAYRGLLVLVGAHYRHAAPLLLGGVVCSLAAYLLCRYANDLMDR